MSFRKAGFEPISLRSGSVGSNAGAAASAVSTGKIFADIRANSPKFGDIANTAMQVEAAEKMAAEKNETDLQISENNLKATQDQASAAKSSGMMSALGTVAGAVMGTTTVTSYVESGAGVKAGGKTGMTSLVIGLLFLACIPKIGIFT